MSRTHRTHRTAAALATAAVLLAASCTDNTAREAARWLQAAQAAADRGDHTAALAAIDSLRHNCPDAITERLEALKLWQQASLRAAQQAVERTDRALQAATVRHDRLAATVDSLRAANSADAATLTLLTRLRMRRDSLRAARDVECAKIKYIRAKMKE